MSGDIDQTARLNGVWGGDNIVMEISDKGATIEYECGSGTIDGAIVLDKNGSFKTSGMHTKERGGPRRGESTPANYSGRTDGKTMTLIVTLTKTNENVGTFTLERGRRPQLTKCM